ncbi:2-succinyl-6-hydroxy-2,4-cyclohexadiene-1-carboxylate synthase [Thermomicrobium sp. 4228-Ro]|uniref:2-succinyl-6-hydroxy-2, 4-cyclohexadiene-1-carboxylate synthase n=1 Tax=Thermomicrobium sp. 4228-Ro TaxID=2993937 RepID=UPI0022497216|nr:2-succinyl-6-hydroxy-2,4-cyclohexadiene-1-carboxylate synthase [Thermomicrobium sp. 4228-Ro]MCX2728261.1 2-succinyl-6-hydroxy-2,4-cyclohexadiene-1-carboxylate synthase [Thermomicrobium sp. 4228-Ro]
MRGTWTKQRLPDVRGVRYRVRLAGQGRPLLLLHGFAGSSLLWTPLVPALLARGWQVIAPDLLGHGGSEAPADPARYTASEQVADLATLLDALDVTTCTVAGYSMGGRLALQFAVRHPARVTALVLESASPGLLDLAERTARRQADETLAQAIEQRGIDWFADYWDNLPLFASRRALPDDRLALLRSQWLAQRPHGLAAALRGFGTGTMPPLWDQLHELDQPTLVIVGALDAKYVAIGRAMTERIPRSRLVVVPDTGHTVHLERPDAWLAALDTLPVL